MSAVEAAPQPDQPPAEAPPAQDELKKDVTTEDESSQDSKLDPIDTKTVTDNGDSTIKDEPTNGEKEPEDEKPAATENGKIEDDTDIKEESASEAKSEKPEENGEAHESETKTEDGDEAEKKPAAKKDDTEDDEEVDEEEEEGDEEGDGEEGDEKEDKPSKKDAVLPPKKAKKVKSADDGEGEDDEEEEEEEGEDGEVDEEEEIEGEEGEEEPQPKKKKEPSEPPVPVPAGKGIPLGHIPNVEIAISRFKIEDLKFLHQFLYNQLCRTNLIKRNIKKFKGYEYEKDSAEYKEKVEETQKFEPKQLRMLCEMLDLDKRGSPNDLSTRIVGFCLLPKNQSPHARGAVKERPLPESTPGGRPRRSAAVKVARGYSDEEYESDPETKVKGPRAHREESADSDGSYNPSGSGQDPDSDFDPAAVEGAVTRKRRGPTRSSGKGRRGRPKGSKGKKSQTSGRRGRGRKPANSDSEDESESESGSEDESESDGEESDPLTSEPPSKRGRGAVTARGRKLVAVKRKGAPVKKKAGPASLTKGRAAGKKRKTSSSEDSDEGSVEEEEGSDEEGSSEDGSEDDQEAATPAKKAKHPPTDDEIKKYVEQILEGANLEEITMKTVCKQVYSHYPDFDLAHKKDFIKATVKSLISS